MPAAGSAGPGLEVVEATLVRGGLAAVFGGAAGGGAGGATDGEFPGSCRLPMGGGLNPATAGGVETAGAVAGAASCPTGGGLMLTGGAARTGAGLVSVTAAAFGEGAAFAAGESDAGLDSLRLTARIMRPVSTAIRLHRMPRAMAFARPWLACWIVGGDAMPFAAGKTYGTIPAPQCQCFRLLSPIHPPLHMRGEMAGSRWRSTVNPWRRRLEWKIIQACSGWTAP